MPDLDDHESAVWVSADVAPRGGYLITVHYTPNRSISLDPVRALTYVNQAVSVAARAEYGAAVLAQMTHMGVGDKVAGVTVAELMQDAWEGAELADGIQLVPMIASRNRWPYLFLDVDGHRITQWAPADLHDHAMNILRVRACADLDTRYKKYLTTRLQLEEDTAAALVGDLARHRKDDEGGTDAE